MPLQLMRRKVMSVLQPISFPDDEVVGADEQMADSSPPPPQPESEDHSSQVLFT